MPRSRGQRALCGKKRDETGLVVARVWGSSKARLKAWVTPHPRALGSHGRSMSRGGAESVLCEKQ